VAHIRSQDAKSIDLPGTAAGAIRKLREEVGADEWHPLWPYFPIAVKPGMALAKRCKC
jgi:hypothetical protein